MKNKIMFIAILLFVFLYKTHAQEAIVASGGEASSSGGKASYSIGQVLYTTNIGTNGSVAQGVQQPFEISVLLGIDNQDINLGLTVYPNPTTNLLTLNVSNTELSNFNFQLSDMTGKLIESRKIRNSTESIGMEDLPKSIYFLKLTNNNKEVKTFKIIKN